MEKRGAQALRLTSKVPVWARIDILGFAEITGSADSNYSIAVFDFSSHQNGPQRSFQLVRRQN